MPSKLLRQIILFIAIQVALVLFVGGIWLFHPRSDQVENDYLYSAIDLRDRMSHSRSGNRVILLGGSSIGMGVSAKQLTAKLDRRVFNIGVHGGLGYQNIWSIYKSVLRPGQDVIVLSPEYEMLANDSRYSIAYCRVLYLANDAAKMLMQPECWVRVGIWTGKSLLGRFMNWSHPRNIYYRNAVNEYGDVVSHLRRKGQPLTNIAIGFPEESDVTDYLGFVKTQIIDAGFDVVYVPVTVAQSACEGVEEQIVDIQAQLWSELGSGKMPAIEKACLADDLFYDSIYHAAQRGRIVKTGFFADVISAAFADRDIWPN